MPEAWRQQPVRHADTVGAVDLAISLDQHLYPALLPLIQAFGAQQGLKIAVQEGTCGISAGGLQKKAVDIGGFCCPPAATDRLPGLRFHTLGIAPISLLVNAANPLNDLDLEQARALFGGRIGYWRDLDPAAAKLGRVQSVGRLHCKLRPGHWRLLLPDEEAFSPRLQEVSTIPDMLDAVARDRGALGYEVLWMLSSFTQASKIKALRLNGIDPADSVRVLSGHYPLYRTYNITTWDEEPARNAHVQDLLIFLRGHSSQSLEEHGIIPAARLREAGWRFRDAELIGEPE